MRPKLAVIATHPVQYYAPLFRRLTARGVLELRVFYGWEGASGDGAHDPGFGQAVRWDVPLLDGYAYEFVPNRAADPGTHHFGGLDNPELVPRVLSWQPDAVLVFGWAWKSHLKALRALHGRVPVLFRGDSTLLDEQPGPKTLARRAWLRWVYRHVNMALYVGTYNRLYFENHGLHTDELMWAPHAVEDERFADPDGLHTAEAQRWRRRLGIPDEVSTVLYAGKLERKKAPEVLLEAFLDLGTPNAHLLFAGSGPMEKRLRERGARNPRVHFLGFQNQSAMPAVYRLGDVVVLPSRGPGETWGLAVNEAMACGRPVIVSDRVGCAPDLVQGGGTGLVVPAGDAAALREALVVLLSDLPSRKAMGAAGARLIEQWSLGQLAEAIEAATRRWYKADAMLPLGTREGVSRPSPSTAYEWTPAH